MNRSQAGFSLIELMFALMILAVGIAGMARGVTASLSASKESEIQTKAALFAAGRIELLRAEGFYIQGEEEGDCGIAVPGHSWQQTITETEPEGLYEVSIEIIPTNAVDRISFRLDTMLFEPPLGLNSSTDRENARRTERQSERQSQTP